MVFERSMMIVVAALMVLGASGCTPGLVDATRKSDSAAVKSLLEGKADPNVRDETESTPLHVAARSGSLDITQMLVASKADVNATNKSGQTPLQCAAMGGHDEVVTALLKAGANVNPKPSNDGLTPLRCAIQKKTSTAKLLLDQGAAPGAGLKDCIEDAIKGKQSQTLALLLQRPDANLEQKVLADILGTALIYYDAANIGLLLDKGADPKKTIHMMTRDVSTVKRDVGPGYSSIEMRRSTQMGYGPAVFAPIEHGDTITLQKFLAKGCGVDEKDSFGRTPLEFAQEKNNSQIVAMIRDRMAK